MSRINSYEDLAFVAARQKAILSEVYSGADMVGYWGEIQRILNQKIRDMSTQLKQSKVAADTTPGRQPTELEQEKNALETFLQLWNATPLDGSLSVSKLKILHGAAIQASSNTSLKTYDFFSRIRDNLGRVIAKTQELPTVPSSTGKSPIPGGGLPSRSMAKPTPPTGDFGAQKEPPTPGSPPKPGEPKKPNPPQPAGTPPARPA
jgi:hypothetical protein